MSLSAALKISAANLGNLQTTMRTVAGNVGNAQTEGYSRREVIAETWVAGQQELGTRIVDIRRAVAGQLQKDLLGQNAQAAGDRTLETIYTRVDALTGAASGEPTLTRAMKDFEIAWKAFESNPELGTLERQVVRSGQDLVISVHDLAEGLDKIEADVKTSIGLDIGEINDRLDVIHRLNAEVADARARGVSTPTLDDQRDAAIAGLSQLVDIRTFERPNGSMAIMTGSGYFLIDREPARFEWDGTDVTLQGPSAASLNGEFRSGKIAAQLGLLKTDAASVATNDAGLATFEKVRQQLDSFVQQFHAIAPAPSAPFQAAYDGAPVLDPTELPTSFFVNPGGAPPAPRYTFDINPNLVNGTQRVKKTAGNAVVADLSAANRTLTVGGLNISGTTYRGLADGITGQLAKQHAYSQAKATRASEMQHELQTRIKNDTGVNLDEELANMIAIQQSFGATGRVIQAVDEMMRTLESIGR